MGIDVFRRNTYGGGQWNANVALDVIRKNEVSAAIFAPGWVYETKQPPDFETAQNSWWGLVEKSWGVLQNYTGPLPLHTNFDQGRGYHISVDGNNVSDAAWCNISCQGFQPLLPLTSAIHRTTYSLNLLINNTKTTTPALPSTPPRSPFFIAQTLFIIICYPFDNSHHPNIQFPSIHPSPLSNTNNNLLLPHHISKLIPSFIRKPNQLCSFPTASSDSATLQRCF
ncbi:hypothetical protein RYX36_023444 [Vicia faba]